MTPDWITKIKVIKCLSKTGNIKNANTWRSITHLQVQGANTDVLRISTTVNSSGNLETTITPYIELNELSSLVQNTSIPAIKIVHIEQSRCTESAVGEYHHKVLTHYNLLTTNF